MSLAVAGCAVTVVPGSPGEVHKYRCVTDVRSQCTHATLRACRGTDSKKEQERLLNSDGAQFFSAGLLNNVGVA